MSGHRTVTAEMIVEDIRRVLTGQPKIGYREYLQCGGRYSRFHLIRWLFGSWPEALVRAGLSGIVSRQSAIIPCLRCDYLFASEDRVYNRICQHCQETEDWRYPEPVYAFQDSHLER